MDSHDDFEQILKKSGNSFHGRVIQHLRENDWKVLISPYYLDNISGKPREIDLIAEKKFTYNNVFNQFPGTIHIQLFIECKYIAQKTVFWFDEKDTFSTLKILTEKTPLTKNNINTGSHHYFKSNRVAKLFASEQKQSTENEIIYKALNQSLSAMTAGRNYQTIFPDDGSSQNNTFIYYPVILCNSFSNFRKTEFDQTSTLEKIEDNFQLETNYTYTSTSNHKINEFFLVDIVDFDKIDNFLADLKTDVDVIRFFLSPS